MRLKNIKNPYGKGNSAEQIMDIISKLDIPTHLKKNSTIYERYNSKI